MSMNINSEGKLVIEVQDIFDALSHDATLELIESLSCSEIVIKHVADQLLEGWTENGYHGSICSGLTPSTQINGARDKIAKGANDIATKRIAELERMVALEKEATKTAWDSYHTEVDRRNKSY